MQLSDNDVTQPYSHLLHIVLCVDNIMVSQRTTIKDVAKQAGVSIKTVSRVINDEPYVRDATRQRVLDAIDSLGFVVSQPAKRLSSGQSYTIGLIFHNASWHYIQNVQRGVLETVRKRGGYSALLHPCDTNCRDDIKEILNLVHQSMVDGFIFTPPVDNDRELIENLQQLDVPFIRLTPQDRKSPLPYVTATDLQGAFEMTDYLIGLGHRRIGFIHGPVEQRAAHDRFKGYKQALTKANLEFDPNLIQKGNDLFDSGTRASSILLELDPLPSAIFCNNDEMAAGAITAVFEQGLHVPGEISVAGFDNIPLASQIWPPLTTVNQPIFEIAETATNHLIRLLSGEDVKQLYHELSTNLVIRKSTAVYNST